MHLAILLVAAVAASNQYGPGYGGQPSHPIQPSQYPPSYPYPQPAPLPYPPYGDEGQGVPRCRNCRRVRAFKDDAKLAYGTVLIKEKRSLGRCTVSIVTCKGEEGQTFTLIDEKKRTLARGSHIRHKITCMGRKRWKTKNADDEKVVFTKLACVVNPVATTVGPSTTACASCTKESIETEFNPANYKYLGSHYNSTDVISSTADGCLKRTFTCAWRYPDIPPIVIQLGFFIDPNPATHEGKVFPPEAVAIEMSRERPAEPVSGDLVCDSTGRWLLPNAENVVFATPENPYPTLVFCRSD